MNAEERYQHDSTFHALTDALERLIAAGETTPSELRAALILACTHYELRRVRPLVWELTSEELKRRVLASIEEREW